MEESTPRGCFGFLQVGRWAPSTCPRWSRWSDCVRPPRVRVCVRSCPLAAYGPRLEDAHCGEAIREGNMGKFYRAADLLPQNGRAAYTREGNMGKFYRTADRQVPSCLRMDGQLTQREVKG